MRFFWTRFICSANSTSTFRLHSHLLRKHHIDRACQDQTALRQAYLFAQISINFFDHTLVCWFRGRGHHQHSLHDFILVAVIGQRGIRLIGPVSLAWSRHPIGWRHRGYLSLVLDGRHGTYLSGETRCSFSTYYNMLWQALHMYRFSVSFHL